MVVLIHPHDRSKSAGSLAEHRLQGQSPVFRGLADFFHDLRGRAIIHHLEKDSAVHNPLSHQRF
jgi:hypothetical protein